MSSSPRNSEAGRNLPESGPDERNSVSRNVYSNGEASPFEPLPGQVAAEQQPASPGRPTWQPVDQEALIQRHPSLTGLVNPAFLSGSVENPLAGGDALPSGGGRPETASPPPPQSGRTDSPRSRGDATGGPTSPNRRPPLGSPRRPPLPPSSPTSRAADSAGAPARRELSGSARGEDGGGEPEQNISTPLLGRTEGGQDSSRPQAWGGFGAIASRFTPESINGTNTEAKQPTAARQRHLSLPNFVGNLFGIKQNDPTETPPTPDTTGVSHLRGGSFGLPNYGPGGVPPAALASRNAGRRWARSGSWAPGHVILVQPRPLFDANIKEAKTKSEPHDSPVSRTIFEDREEELGDDEPLCRICLDLLIMEGMEQMKMQCKCRGELALAHKECAVKWFTIRGSRICDVCGSEVENLPVIIYRRPPPRVLIPMRPMPTLEQEEDPQE